MPEQQKRTGWKSSSRRSPEAALAWLLGGRR
jgi:hypothetical protein